MTDDQIGRFQASGWHAQAVDGHDPDAIARAIEAARASDRPSLIACRTTIGYGAPTKAGTAATHGAPLGEAEIAGAREELGWPYPAFQVPTDIQQAWRAAGARGAEDRAAWQGRLDAEPEARRHDFERTEAGDLPRGWKAALDAHIARVAEERPKWATRQASGEALEVLTQAIPEMIGGSADLTGSNNTKVSAAVPVTAGAYGGDYVFYGVREHAMAAAMNGIALHGGLIPFSGTFLVFTDYMRPSLRLAALMGIRAIHVLTHDSIGLGEDGPTHQPVETLAAMRAIPGYWLFRPADAVETAECWALALERRDGPSGMALTRQGVPTLRDARPGDKPCARGAYVLAEGEGGARRVDPARHPAPRCPSPSRPAKSCRPMASPRRWSPCPAGPCSTPRTRSIGTACWAPGTIRVAVEAAVSMGWDRYIGETGAFVGMTGFGASAPGGALYEHFGITATKVVEAARAGMV